MLKNAIDFKSEIQENYNKIKYDEKYKFLFVHKITECFDLRTGKDEGCVEYVSVSKKDNRVIGYLLAEIDLDWGICSNLRILNFAEKDNITFAKDLRQFLINLFTIQQVRKIQFQCINENPIIKMYIKYVERYNGNIVGTFKNAIRLSDGKIYDYTLFEVFKEDFDRINNDKNGRNGKKNIKLG